MGVSSVDAIDDPQGPFAVAASAMESLDELDLDALSAAELNEAVARFQDLRARLEAAEARVIARWDADKCWQLDEAKTGPAWMAWRSRLPIQETRRRLRHARFVRKHEAISKAWAAGEIDRTHVTTLLGACNPRTEGLFERDHKVLLDDAKTLGYVDFKRCCDLWEQLADPDGAERDADDDIAVREAHFSQSFGGMWFGRQTLDPVNGAIIHETLKIIERELFEADWAAAKQRLGREPLIMELDRTPAQRRADAFVEMAIRARTAPADGRRPAPLFTVLVDYPSLAGRVLELANRTVISPGTAARWLTEADVERVVFDGPSRVVDVGAQRRFYRGALRRAIEVRDRTCFHPTCDEVPERPHIDHIHEAAKGGMTTQQNGRLGCDHHNLLRNKQPSSEGDRASPNPGDPHAGDDPPDL